MIPMVKFMPEEEIRAAAEELLARVGAETPPVPVEDIARSVGARVVLEALDTDLSGVLHVVEETPLIAVNSSHPGTRQRFTIAHELGHLSLHDMQTFVDRDFVFRRDQKAASGNDREEIQANMFAAELLMPREWLVEDAGEHGFEIGEDDELSELARRYGVSQSAMLFRLANLDLVEL